MIRALKMGADDYDQTILFLRAAGTHGGCLALQGGAQIRQRNDPPLQETSRSILRNAVTVGGRPVHLSAIEYKLLYELATHAGRVLTYDQILQRVWGSEYAGDSGLLRSSIRNLRRKLGDDGHNPRYVLTETQVGYRMPKPQG
jgi:two-component system KDP operon response regulator KdpE